MLIKLWIEDKMPYSRITLNYSASKFVLVCFDMIILYEMVDQLLFTKTMIFGLAIHIVRITLKSMIQA